MEENEILKLKKNLNDMKQKNLDLYKRIKARDNIIKQYSSKYKDLIFEKEIEKIKMNEKNGAYPQKEGNEKSREEDIELIESLGKIIQQNDKEINLIQSLLDREKENNKNKDNLIMEKEKEIRNLKEKLEEEQKFNLGKNEEISNLKNILKSNEVEMKKQRDQIELLQNVKNSYEVKLKEYEDQVKNIKYEINKNPNPIRSEIVHEGIKCQKCFQEPIIGYRYKCSVCNDYDLCQNRKNLNKSTIDVKKYSYECINILQLSMYLYEGTEKGQSEIILKNNGSQAWPEGRTKLVFERESEISGDEIVLRPQKPGEIGKYNIILRGLNNYSHKQYKSYLNVFIDDDEVGEQLILTINIKEKDTNKKEIENNMEKIIEFRNNYNLGIEDYSDEVLFKALKKNNYDYDASFSSLFPEL